MLQRTIIILLLIFISIPAVSFANGGDQRVIKGKYLINLSRAPFTPRAGEQTSMLASFVDLQKNKLISEDIIVKVRVARLSGGAEREFLFERDNINAQGGVLEFKHTFTEVGLHEIFFDFAFASDPQTIYKAPDFLLDIQKPLSQNRFNNLSFLLAGITGIIGLAAGFVIGRFTRGIR